jgi:hypothetical protein
MIRGEICQPFSVIWPHLFLTICCGGRGGETQEEFSPSGAYFIITRFGEVVNQKKIEKKIKKWLTFWIDGAIIKV